MNKPRTRAEQIAPLPPAGPTPSAPHKGPPPASPPAVTTPSSPLPSALQPQALRNQFEDEPSPSKTSNSAIVKQYNDKQRQLKALQARLFVLRNRDADMQAYASQLAERSRAIQQRRQQVEQILGYRDRDKSEQLRREQALRDRNRASRREHAEELKNISMAVYMVKRAEAEEIKQVSQEHAKHLANLREKELQAKFGKAKDREQEHASALQSLRAYRNNRFLSISVQKQQAKERLKDLADSKERLIHQLEAEERMLIQKFRTSQLNQSALKNQLAEALKDSRASSGRGRRSAVAGTVAGSEADSRSDQMKQSSRSVVADRPRRQVLPLAGLDEDKLRVALQRVRKGRQHSQSQMS